MKLLFIDANIYLKFYALKDEWNLFDRVSALLSKKKVELLFPDVTFNEVVRNVYADGLLSKDSKKIESCITITPNEKTTKEIGLNETDIKDIRDEVENYKNDKLFRFKEEKLDYAKQYEKKIEELKSLGITPEETEELVNKAHRRHLLGHPPSKRSDPIGDNLVWEMILKLYKNDEIFIVSKDPDWRRDNFSYHLNTILEREWKKASDSKNITLVPSLGELISKLDPEDPVSKEVIKKEKEVSFPQMPGPLGYYPPVCTVTVVEPIMPFSGSAVLGSFPTGMGTLAGGSYVGGFQNSLDKSGWCYNCSVWFKILPFQCPSCGQTLT